MTHLFSKSFLYLFGLRCILFVFFSTQLCAINISADNEILLRLRLLRDSLDSNQMLLPRTHNNKNNTVVIVDNQLKWDTLSVTLTNILESGNRNIYVKVIGDKIIFGENSHEFVNLFYPDANITIDGSDAIMRASGQVFIKNSDDIRCMTNNFYTRKYQDFGISDTFIGKDGREILLREDVFEIQDRIEEVREFGKFFLKKFATDVEDSITMVWRFPVSLPDIGEDECKDFFILLTRDWISCRHRVRKVEGGYLYFNINSPDFSSSMSPNRDWEIYRVNPRCRFINCPVSKVLHYWKGVLYIPKNYKEVRIAKGYRLISLTNCQFNRFTIKGFIINGSGDGSIIDLLNCSFREAMTIQDNTFDNISNLAINSVDCENVNIINNKITNSRKDVIYARGKNTTISCNCLRNIGWMMNTRAIIGGGDRLHISDNIIDDFYYAAIACGNVAPNTTAIKPDYIIERNIIRLSKEHTDNYKCTSLADGGGIYIGPQCKQGIIRNNVILNIKGIHSNRGIFLDDGAKNLAVYGNLIAEVFNCYDIDLRLSRRYEQGIPDHNNNNSVFNNIMCGGYRFQDDGSKSNCIGGMNILLCCGNFQDLFIELNNRIDDVRLEGASYENGKVRIPKRYSSAINTIKVDSFVYKYISFH